MRSVPELSRSQVVVYGAVAVALLLIGARAIQGEGGGDSSFAASAAAGPAPAGGFEVSGQAGDLIVDVTGAVARPGVYRLPAGSRVDDAVRRAGGATGSAELEAVNLAARLTDGQQVVVPERGAVGAAAAGAGGEGEGPISLGTATVEELDTIDGIGPVTAEDIVRFRDEHGGLASVDQLDQISGIGPATMESLRARLQP
ncbi:MAG: helix-hairpin-helix domain-containing protein [Syntrophothermus sp.]